MVEKYVGRRSLLRLAIALREQYIQEKTNALYKEYDVSEKTDFTRFIDSDKVNTFAKEAMQWAVGTGIISGKENGTMLDPQGNATRAECAAIMMRFLEKYQ